jgi:hypothetical protein
MALFDTKPGLKAPDMGKSIQNNDAIGSGARPVPSKVKIATSEPDNAHTMGRAPEGWLR